MYAPAGNLTTTSSIQHLATVYYNRQGLDVLRKKFIFATLGDPMMIPMRNGKTIQFFRYSTLGANTTPKAEGQIGTSLQLTSSTLSATVSQYADFITFSDMLVDTAIDDVVSQGVTELSYRAALSVDNIVRAEVDSGALSTSLLGTYLQAKDLAMFRSLFAGVDIRPFRDNYFKAVVHPYVSYDLLNDPAAGGFQDLVKHDASSPGRDRLVSMEDRGFVARIHSTEVWENTNVTVTEGTPDTYRMYVAGAGGLGIIDLAGRGPSKIKDPKSERFKIKVISPGHSIADPEGVIRAAASYNYVFAAKTLDATNQRIRYADVPSSIVS